MPGGLHARSFDEVADFPFPEALIGVIGLEPIFRDSLL
jgi:hypothetical protein